MTVADRETSLAKRVDETVAQVQLAEQMDFDIAWFAEHHFSNYSMCPSPTLMGAYAAAQTQRIRLGPAVLVLPLYHPVRLVEELALLDVQSKGRLVIGLGSGYQEYEFEGFGLNIADKLSMMHELPKPPAPPTITTDFPCMHVTLPNVRVNSRSLRIACRGSTADEPIASTAWVACSHLRDTNVARTTPRAHGLPS